MAKKNSVDNMTPIELATALERVPRLVQSDRGRHIMRNSAALLRSLIEKDEQRSRDDAERYEKSAKLQTIGRNAAESLAEMVAAYKCDYDRLEELRDERKALADDIGAEGQTKAQRAKAQAALEEWDESNADELKELQEAAGECESQEAALERIREDPLSIELTYAPCQPGETPEADGFIILLSTGGPAVRIVGVLDEHNEPKRAWIEAQDWFLPWTEYHGDGIEHDSLLTYCRCFSYYSGNE